jgi:C4-dicarboxylate-specific signal transduction histidine kinase
MDKVFKKIIRRNSRKTVIFLPKSYKQELIKMQKFVQIGKISSGLIHDLTSPITALGLQLEYMNNNKASADIFIQSIRESIEEISNYSKLVKNYISNKQEDESVFLNELINDTFKLLSYKAKQSNVQLQFISNERIILKTKPVYFYQIMISLLSNAIESYEKVSGDKKVIVKLEKFNYKTQLTIKDFGCGIKDIDKIFSFFYTTKGMRGGSGIGMSNVKHIVEEELGGEIIVESEIGKGTAFKILI